VAEPLRRLRFQIDTVAVVHPNIADAIVRYATENKVDTVALGTHGRGGWNRLASGSVTQDILHSARLPMIVLHTADITEFEAPGLATAAV
jgi:nucleotide-binding universal stress UspA family protein